MRIVTFFRNRCYDEEVFSSDAEARKFLEQLKGDPSVSMATVHDHRPVTPALNMARV